MKPTATAIAIEQQKKAPVSDRIRPELNLEKWSIWQPAKSKNPLKAKTLQREITLADGSKITAKVEIAPTTRGVLTTEDQKTLYALIKHWEEKGRPETPTFFSLKGLAKLLKKRWGSNVIQALTESLVRLRITAFIWENSYYDKTSRETVEVLDPFNILADLKIVKRKQDGHVTKEAGYFRFNDFILNNLLANHTKPLLFDVVVGFKSEIAQLLYVYLDLLMADKTLYERRTKELFDDLGLEGKTYRHASERKRTLERALDELQGVPLTTGRLTTAKLEQTKDGKDYKAVFRKGTVAVLEPVAEDNGDEEPAVQSPPEKDRLTSQGADLVKHFYQAFYGNNKTTISSKSLAQAISLIAQVGFEQAKYVVDFAKLHAPETGYNPQTFGGIIQYTARAVAEYEEQQHRLQRRAEQQFEEAERLRLEEAYAAYCKEQLESFLQTEAGAAEFKQVFEEQRKYATEKLSPGQPAGEAVDNWARALTRAVLARRIDTLSFEAYTEIHQERAEQGTGQPPSDPI